MIEVRDVYSEEWELLILKWMVYAAWEKDWDIVWSFDKNSDTSFDLDGNGAYIEVNPIKMMHLEDFDNLLAWFLNRNNFT